MDCPWKTAVSEFALQVSKRWILFGRISLLGICFYERNWGNIFIKNLGKDLRDLKVIVTIYPFRASFCFPTVLPSLKCTVIH